MSYALKSYWDQLEETRVQLTAKGIAAFQSDSAPRGPQVRPTKFSKMSGEQLAAEVEERLHTIEKNLGDFGGSITRQGIDVARAVPRAYLETIEIIKNQQFQKAWDVPTSPIAGLVAYDLEVPAKLLYPVLSPIRNRVPRTGGVGTAANWRAVVDIDRNNVGVGVTTGARGGVIIQSDFALSVPYRTIGLENYVTFEMQSSSVGFEDVLALAVLQVLQALMIREELLLIGGVGLPSEINGTSFALGQTPTPNLASSASTGSLGTAQYWVKCVALTLEAMTRVDTSLATALPTTISRTNADGTNTVFNAGCSKASAAGTITFGSGTTNAIAASVTAVPNAYGYAWFTSSDNTNFYGAAFTNTNAVTLKTVPTGNAQLPADLVANDRSANMLVFDGIWTQSFGALSAYVTPTTMPSGGTYYSGTGTMTENSGSFPVSNFMTLNGANFTSSGDSNVTELLNLMQWQWDLWKFGCDTIYVGGLVQRQINNIVFSNGGAPLYRFNLDANSLQQKGASGGGTVINLINPFFGAGKGIQVVVHPYLPPGYALTYTDSLPYALSNVSNLAQVRAKRDYYAQEWPLRTRKYEYGVYSEQLVETYFPPAFAAVACIGTPAFMPVITMGTQSNIPPGAI